MAEYLPPTENVAIFDTLNFNDGNSPLTYNKAVKYFLRYPSAQGTETLQVTNVNGLLTASAGIKVQSIEPITNNIAGAITIGSTLSGASATIKIGTTGTTGVDIGNFNIVGTTLKAGSNASAVLSMTTNTQSASLYDGNTTGNVTMATGQTTGICNIATGARSYTAVGTSGAINIGTGTATGLTTNGCIMNIGTGNRTVYSAINIGTGNNDANSPISIGTGLTTAAGVFIGKGAASGAQTGSLVLNSVETQGVYLGNTSTTGNIQIGQSQTDGKIEIGFGASRTANGIININNNVASAAPMNIGKLNISAPNASGTTISSSGTGYLTIRNTTTDVTAGIKIGDASTGGQHFYSDSQTTGYIKMGTANRSYLDATSTGRIDIGTGSATGSGANGVLINIGTGSRTVNSSINIGTGTRDNTSDINIGVGATNAGHLHLQDGNSNSGNVHIANGTFNTGNVNILNGVGTSAVVGDQNQGDCNIQTGAYNRGVLNVQTSATGVGSVNIGNSANTTGSINLNAHTVNIGTNGDTTAVIALNNPIQPNYIGSRPTTIGTGAVGYQFESINGSFTAGAPITTNYATLSVPNGVWLFEIFWDITNATSGIHQLSLSGTSGVIEQNRSSKYAASTAGGLNLTTVIPLAATTTLYIVFYTQAPIAASNVAYRYTRIA